MNLNLQQHPCCLCAGYNVTSLHPLLLNFIHLYRAGLLLPWLQCWSLSSCSVRLMASVWTIDTTLILFLWVQWLLSINPRHTCAAALTHSTHTHTHAYSGVRRWLYNSVDVSCLTQMALSSRLRELLSWRFTQFTRPTYLAPRDLTARFFGCNSLQI